MPNTCKTAGWVEIDGNLFWREVLITEKKLSEIGCVILAKKEKDDEHLVYKSVRCPMEDVYVWSALWNTCAVTSVEEKYKFESAEEAVRAMRSREGWVVWRSTFAELTGGNCKPPQKLADGALTG